MARPIRIERAGGWYHVTARGNERRPIFRDHRDRQHFSELLAEMVSRFRVRLHCFVLMDNHYHLVLELTEPNLSRTGQWLNVSYSLWFNRRHERSGHLFQGRFKSVAVSPEEWGLELSRYVHLNPVRTGKWGLSKSEQQRIHPGLAGAPEDRLVEERIRLLRSYPWSSYRAYIGLAKQPEWLECEHVLALGAGRKEARPRRYRDYVEAAVREGLDRSPWEEATEQVVLGGEKFLNRIRRYVSGDPREQRRAKRLSAARPSLKQVMECVEAVKGQKWAEFRDRYGDSGRDLILYLGRTVGGLKLDELARASGLNEYAAVGMAVTRYRKRLQHDRSEQKQIRQISKMLNVEM